MKQFSRIFVGQIMHIFSKLSKVSIAILVIYSVQTRAQCPVLNLSVEDTLCSNETFFATGLSSTYAKYTWTFGLESFTSLPNLTDMGNPSSSLSSNTFGITIVKSDSLYYGFVKKSNARNVYRYDFGASLSNTPSVTALNINSFTGETSLSDDDIDILKIGNTWYGFTPIRTGNAIIRYNFGSSLENNTVTATNLGNLNNQLNVPTVLKADYFNDSLLLTVGSFSANSFTIYNMGTNPTNSSSVWHKTQSMNGTISVNQATALETYYNCDGFVVFAAGYASDNLVRYNFQGSVFNTPSITEISSSGNIQNPYAMKLVFESGKPQIFIKSRTSTKNIYRVDFSNNPEESLTAISIDEINTNASTSIGVAMAMAYANDALYFFIVTNTGTLKKSSVPYKTGLSTNQFYTFQPSNLSFTSDNSFTYGLTALDNAGNNFYFQSAFYITPAPNVSANIMGTCLGSPTTFEAFDTENLTGVSWHWNYGDGNIADVNDTIHAYSAAGAYTVALSASTSLCADSLDTNIYINALPSADFSLDTTCQGYFVNIGNNSTFAGQDSIAYYWWTTEQGDTSGLFSPVFMFADSGYQSIQLSVITTAGCVDTVLDSAYIKPAALANFTVSSTCLGDTTFFTNHPNSSLSYNSNWDFGGQGTSSSLAPSFLFTDTGNVWISLTTTTANGCTNNMSEMICISPTPSILFQISANPYCQFSPIDILDYSASADPITTKVFAIGEDTISGYSISFAPSEGGVFPAFYQIVAGTDCRVDSVFTIKINNVPTVYFTYSDSCQFQEAKFVSVSAVGDGQSIIQNYWRIGNAISGYGDSIFFTASVATAISAVLISTTDSGCVDSAVRLIEIYKHPSITIQFDGPFCSDLVVEENSVVTLSINDSLIKRTWTIHNTIDTAIFTLGEPLQPKIAGEYLAVIELESQKGCYNTDTATLSVGQSPFIEIDLNDSVCEQILYDIESNYDGSNYQFNWQCSDGVSAGTERFSHLFPNSGIYRLMHTITDKTNGCYDTSTTQIYVGKTIDLQISDQSICASNIDSLTYELTRDSLDQVMEQHWYINGKIASSDSIYRLFYNDPTNTINVRLDVLSEFGCTATSLKNISIIPLPSSNFNAEVGYGNVPFETVFITQEDFPTNIWTLNGDTFSTAAEPRLSILTKGFFLVERMVIDTNGCQNSSSQKLHIYSGGSDLALNGLVYDDENSNTTFSFSVTNSGETVIYGFDVLLLFQKGTQSMNSFIDTLSIGEKKWYDIDTRFFEIDRDQQVCLSLQSLLNLADENADNNKICIPLSKTNDWLAFPNPTSDWTKCSFYADESEEASISVYNKNGQAVSIFNQKLAAGYNEIFVDFSTGEAGIYEVRISTSLRTYVFTIVKL